MKTTTKSISLRLVAETDDDIRRFDEAWNTGASTVTFYGRKPEPQPQKKPVRLATRNMLPVPVPVPVRDKDAIFRESMQAAERAGLSYRDFMLTPEGIRLRAAYLDDSRSRSHSPEKAASGGESELHRRIMSVSDREGISYREASARVASSDPDCERLLREHRELAYPNQR